MLLGYSSCLSNEFQEIPDRCSSHYFMPNSMASLLQDLAKRLIHNSMEFRKMWLHIAERSIPQDLAAKQPLAAGTGVGRPMRRSLLPREF